MCREIDYDKDIDSIKGIWEKYNDKEEWTKLDDEIKCPKNKTYVNEKESKVKAFLTIRNENVQDNKTNYIFEFYAAKKGEGYGEILLEKMKDERKFLYLHANKKESGLINRYETMGFEEYEPFNTDKKYCMKWVNQKRK